MDPLVSTAWLADNLGARDLRILDCTYVAAETGRDAAAEFAAGHIRGAGFLDLGSLRDTTNDLPNMVPPVERFASRLRGLGVGDGDRIVLYDDAPWRTSARAWWLLGQFGKNEIAILDGGIAKWRAEGRPLETVVPAVRQRHFTPDPQLSGLRDLAAMRTTTDQILDARSAARFTGAEGDPRPGVAPGHMPGALNLPYDRLFESDGTWKRGAALAAAFTDAGVDLDRPVITTCGSGITAAVLAFGLHLLGREAALYDGSWSEWGADPTTPKAVTA